MWLWHAMAWMNSSIPGIVLYMLHVRKPILKCGNHQDFDDNGRLALQSEEDMDRSRQETPCNFIASPASKTVQCIWPSFLVAWNLTSNLPVVEVPPERKSKVALQSDRMHFTKPG